MRLEIRNNTHIIKDVYSGAILETVEGNQIGFCMRDDTIEINIMPYGNNSGNWWRVNMACGIIESQKQAKKEDKENGL